MFFQKWDSMNKNHSDLTILNKSLFTSTFVCKILSDLIREDSGAKNFINNNLKLTNEMVNDAFDVLIKYNEKNDININSFKISSVSGPFISLSRERPTYCKICEKIHENENPFLLIL